MNSAANPQANPPAVEKKKRVYNRKKKTVTVEPENVVDVGESSAQGSAPVKKGRELFPHQLESVELMERAEMNGPIKDSETGFDIFLSFGTLENPVGSGKTAVMLQVVKNDKLKHETINRLSIRSNARNQMVVGDPKTFYADAETGDPVNREFDIVLHAISTNIVVCSKPLTTVWSLECKTMGVAHVVIDAPKHVDGRENFQKLIKPTVDEGNGVIIISNHLYGQAMALIDDISRRPIIGRARDPQSYRFSHYITPKRVIYDDLHSASKWSKNYSFMCPLFTWCINSTPDIVPWAKIDNYLASSFLTRPVYQRYVKMDKGHVVHVEVPETTYQAPPVVVNTLYYQQHAAVKLLDDHLPDAVKAMLASGDFDGAYRKMRDLAYANTDDEAGPSTDSDDSMLVSERRPLQELVVLQYRNKMHSLQARKVSLINMGASTDNVDASIQELQNKIDGLSERLLAADKEECECPICLDDVNRGEMVVTKCCQNCFCKDCIGRVFGSNKTCPLCRKTIGPLDIYSIQADGRVFDISQIMNPQTKKSLEKTKKIAQENIPANSLEALETLVSSKPRGSKFVVFAPTEGSSKAFKEFFKRTAYTLADVGGSAATIRNCLEGFENGSINILFLSSKSSNAGLNLQHATDVVIIDNRPELDLQSGYVVQCVGRVRRFPRRDPVPVHHITVLPH